MYSSRSNPILAGRVCAYKTATHVCTFWARYAVSYEVRGNGLDAPVGVLESPEGYCATHIPAAIRDIWTTHKKAAVVQEVPGMWRNK